MVKNGNHNPVEEGAVDVIRRASICSPEVSIIIPVYNSAVWIEQTLISVLNQPGVRSEIIVVDDGSSDTSLDIVLALADERFTVLQLKENVGVARVRNRALDFARADWVCPFDADDLMSPGRLAPYFSWVVEKPGALWGACGLLIANADGSPRNHAMGQPFDVVGMLAANSVNHGMSLIRKEALQTIGGYDLTVARGIDYSMMLKLALLGEPSFYNDVCYLYRMHEQSLSHVNAYPLSAIQTTYQAWLQQRCAPHGLWSDRAGLLLRVLELHRAVAQECWSDVATMGHELLGQGINTFELKKLTVLGMLRSGVVAPAVKLLHVWLETLDPVPSGGPAAQRMIEEQRWLADQVLRLLLVTGESALQPLGLALAHRLQRERPSSQLASLLQRFERV